MNSRMVSFSLILSMLLTTGCQTIQLRNTTVRQSCSVSDVYYMQVLNNLAMLEAEPYSLPYFSLPQTGQNTTQFSLAATATPGWALVTSGTALLGRFLFSSQAGMFNGTDTNIQTWSTAPTIVPNKLLLMKYAYEAANGDFEHFAELSEVLDYEHKVYNQKGDYEKLKQTIADKKTALDTAQTALNTSIAAQQGDDSNRKLALDVLAKTNERDALATEKKALEEKLTSSPSLSWFAYPYSQNVQPEWFHFGRYIDVPKCARYVGHYQSVYVWVQPGCEQQFTDFTLVILSIATLESPDREKRVGATGSVVKSAR